MAQVNLGSKVLCGNTLNPEAGAGAEAHGLKVDTKSHLNLFDSTCRFAFSSEFRIAPSFLNGTDDVELLGRLGRRLARYKDSKGP